MMRYLFGIAALINAAIVPAMQALAPSSAQPAEQFLVDARALVAQLAKRDFAAVGGHFDARMQAALPAEKLGALWDALNTQFGVFQRQGEARSTEAAGHRIVTIPCVFANAALDARIAYDAAGKVAGLHFVPAAVSTAQDDDAVWAAPAYADPGRFEQRELSVGRAALPATLSVPKGTGPWPAVVLVHGSGAHDRDESVGANKPFRDLAFGLASRGIAVLRYEKQAKAHPENYLGKAFTVDDETTDDALAAAALLRAQPRIDAKRIYVLGHSLGATMAPRIGQRDKQLAGLILLAALATPFQETVVRQSRYLAELAGKNDAATKEALDKLEHQREAIDKLDAKHPPDEPLMLNLPAAYWLDLRGYDPVATAQALTVPMLVLQGGRDYQVSPSIDFPRWQALCAKQPRAQCRLFPGLNHLFMKGVGTATPAEYQRAGHLDGSLVGAVADWLRAVLTPALH